MKNLLPVAVAAVFAAVSFGAVAQPKDDKKTPVQSKQGGGVVSQDKKAVTTATEKPKEAPKAAPAPKAEPKPAAEAGKTAVKSAQGGPVTSQDKKGVDAKSK